MPLDGAVAGRRGSSDVVIGRRPSDVGGAAGRSRRAPPATAASAHRSGSGVGSSTPHAGGVEARGQVDGWHLLDRRRPGRAAGTARVPSRRETRRPPFTTWWMPRDVALSRAARRSTRPTSCAERRATPNSSPTTLSGSPAVGGSLRGGQDLGREVVARRAVQPARADDRRPNPDGSAYAGRRRRPRPQPSRRRTDWGARAGRRVAYGMRSDPRPVEDLIGRDQQQVDARAGRRRWRVDRSPRRCGAWPGRGPARSRRRRSRPRHGR